MIFFTDKIYTKLYTTLNLNECKSKYDKALESIYVVPNFQIPIFDSRQFLV